MPGHPHPRFGSGTIPIRGFTLPYPNTPFRGNKLFSDEPGCPFGSWLPDFEPRHGTPLKGQSKAEDLHCVTGRPRPYARGRFI
jgi:hypothetical protein